MKFLISRSNPKQIIGNLLWKHYFYTSTKLFERANPNPRPYMVMVLRKVRPNKGIQYLRLKNIP
jgi:hypothetical protein